MNKKELQLIRDEIAKAVQVNVNGKIDRLQKGMEEHIKVCLPSIEQHATDMTRINQNIERTTPIVEAFETAQKSGKAALKVFTVAGTVGGAWLIIKQIFPGI